MWRRHNGFVNGTVNFMGRSIASCLVQCCLERAREALMEAAVLLDRSHAKTGVNRLYYACFYAVSALLLTKGPTATRHSGLRMLFQQHVIRAGRLPMAQGQLCAR